MNSTKLSRNATTFDSESKHSKGGVGRLDPRTSIDLPAGHRLRDSHSIVLGDCFAADRLGFP
jgi:hypothetical protein